MFKFNKIIEKAFLAIGGGMYLSTFSNLELDWFIKGYAAIVPIQILALVYALNLIRDRR